MVQFLLAAAVFMTAAGSLVIEIAAGRLIAPFVGMSLYTWTAIIAVVLAGLSVGHWIGGILAASSLDKVRALRYMAWSLAVAAPLSLLVLPLVRVVSISLVTSGMGPIAIVVALTTILFFMPSLLVGIVSPIATKVALDDRPDDTGRVLGRMFAAGAFGSIIGTLSAGYLFISWIGSNGTIIAVAGLYAVMAVGFAVWARQTLVITSIVVVSIAGLSAWSDSVDGFASPCAVESDYFCIRYDNFADVSGRESKIMVLDHLAHGINDRYDPTILYSSYVHFVDEVTGLRLQSPERMNAMFLGGGAYTLPRAWAHLYPTANLTVAEIDPAVTKAAVEEMWFDPDKGNMAILHQDGRTALAAAPGPTTYDVIFGDAFHDIAVPSHLITREFHQLVKSRLSENGFYAANVIDLGREPRFLMSLVKTLQQDFDSVEIWTPVDEVVQEGRLTFIVIAGNNGTGRLRMESRFGLIREWEQWPMTAMKRRVDFDDLPVLTDNYAPVERLLSAFLIEGEGQGER